MGIGRLTLLVIDADGSSLTALRGVVADGLPETRLLTARDSQSGLALARGEDPDVILLDIVKPGEDGCETCRALKDDERVRDIPVLFVTAPETDRESRAMALEAGADGFLSRPFDDVEVAAHVRTMARIKAANRRQSVEGEQLAALVTERTAAVERDLVERRRTEAALRASEDRFRAVFESANVGKSMTLPAGEIHVNKAFADLLGYAPQELVNKTWQEVTLPDDIEATQRVVDALLGGERESARFTKRYLRKDGSCVWADVSVAMRRDDEGRPLNFITTIVDITERRRAEEALEARNRELVALYAVASGLTTARSSTELYGFVARKLKEITGGATATVGLYDPAERHIRVVHAEVESGARSDLVRALGGRRLTETAFPVSDDLRRELLRTPIAYRSSLSEATFGVVSRLVGRIVQKAQGVDRFLGIAYNLDGELFGTSLVALRADAPDPPPALVNSFAEMVAVSMRRVQAEQALRETNDRLSLTLEVGNAGIWEWNRGSDEVRFDARFHALLGYAPGELPTTAQEWATYHHPDDLPAMLSRVEAYSRGDRPFYESEHRIRTKSGTWAWVFTRGRYVDLHSPASPERFVGIAMDVTERKRVEEQSQRQLEELQRWQDVMLGREGRVQELKREVNVLCRAAGQPARYPSEESAPKSDASDGGSGAEAAE